MRSFNLSAAVMALIVSSAASAVTFEQATFDQACQKAKADGKVVLLDFGATWCGPCKLLDEKTWPDAEVTRVVAAKAIAIRVDVDERPELAKRYRVTSVPTVVVARPDGHELGRVEGFHEPKALVAAFARTLDGRDELTRARADVAATGGKDPSARAKLGRALERDGKYAEALEEYVTCFEHGVEMRADFGDVRLTRILPAIARLSRVYPPAGDALRSRLADREAAARMGTASEDLLRDLVWINRATNAQARSEALLDSLAKENPCRRALSLMLVSELVEHRRYADVVEGNDLKAEFAAFLAKVAREAAQAPADQKATYEAMIPEMAAQVGGDYFEALAGVRRDAAAREMAAAVLAVTDTSEVRADLAGRAKAANNPGVAP